jgi:hypothetical protein
VAGATHVGVVEPRAHERLARVGRGRHRAAARIEDPRAAPEGELVLPADAVGHHDRQPVGERVEAQVHVPAGRIVEIVADRLETRAHRCEQQRAALHRRDVDQCRVPRIGADQHVRAPERVKREAVDAVTGAEVAGIVEPAVRREVDLAMHVDDGTVANGHRRIVELCAGRLLHDAERRAHRPGCARQRGDARVVDAHRDAQRIGAPSVPDHRQLREQQHVGAGRACRLHDVEMLAQVRVRIRRNRFDLRRGDVQRAGRVHGQPSGRPARGARRSGSRTVTRAPAASGSRGRPPRRSSCRRPRSR